MEHTDALVINELYPGQLTGFLAPEAQELLEQVGAMPVMYGFEEGAVMGPGLGAPANPVEAGKFVQYTSSGSGAMVTVTCQHRSRVPHMAA